MKEKSLNKYEIKREIEDFLRYGNVFDYVLKKNTLLFSDKLANVEYNNYWFEYEKDNITFSEFTEISETFSRHGNLFYSYINDFKFVGNLCYSDYSHNEHKIEVNIKATLRIYKCPGHEIDLSDRTNHIEVWDEIQKVINLSKIIADEQIKDLELIPYDLSLYTETWSKIDKLNIKKERQVHVTSSYYFQELVECYERIKHLLSFMLLSSTHANKYTEHKRHLPANYKSEFIYETSKNFKLYDRYYLLYCELTIESLYKFWERIGFYLFQFIIPGNNELSNSNFSFYKLIKELNKEYSTNKLIQNENFDWFVNFVLDTNSNFDALTNFRHPFVHYKFDESNKEAIGSLMSTTLNYWKKNLTDKQKLDSLAKENIIIKDFLLKQFGFCKDGYKHAIELIKKQPDKKN